MKTLSQAWMVFMPANVVPNGHVFGLNILMCHLLYCILKDDYSVDVAKLICHEIYKFARFKIGPSNQKAKGTLGFLALINALCAEYGVEVNPSVKIRPPIDLKFIISNYTVAEEQAP